MTWTEIHFCGHYKWNFDRYGRKGKDIYSNVLQTLKRRKPEACLNTSKPSSKRPTPAFDSVPYKYTVWATYFVFFYKGSFLTVDSSAFKCENLTDESSTQIMNVLLNLPAIATYHSLRRYSFLLKKSYINLKVHRKKIAWTKWETHS